MSANDRRTSDASFIDSFVLPVDKFLNDMFFSSSSKEPQKSKTDFNLDLEEFDDPEDGNVNISVNKTADPLQQIFGSMSFPNFGGWMSVDLSNIDITREAKTDDDDDAEMEQEELEEEKRKAELRRLAQLKRDADRQLELYNEEKKKAETEKKSKFSFLPGMDKNKTVFDVITSASYVESSYGLSTSPGGSGNESGDESLRQQAKSESESKQQLSDDAVKRKLIQDAERAERLLQKEKLKQDQEKKRIRERELKLLREEQDKQERLEREAKRLEFEEMERLREEQDKIDREYYEVEQLRLEQEKLRKLKEEHDNERKLREQQTKKIAKQVQKQIDKQELARQSQASGTILPTISKELITKITEVQVNEELANSYSKKKEEEYEKIKAEKIREAEELEAQKNSVVNWMVGGILNSNVQNERPVTVYNPEDFSRTPFEKHLTDTGFRVTLHKYQSVDGEEDEDEEEVDRIDDDDAYKAPKTRKAILRYDPSFNSLYLDVKVEGHSTVFHFNIKRDVKKIHRGLRQSCSLYISGEPQDKTKFVSIFVNFKINDVILEFESVKAAQTVCTELTAFVAFRKEFPTFEVVHELVPRQKSLFDASTAQAVLPGSSYLSIFDIEKTITTEKILEPPKKRSVKTTLADAKEALDGIKEIIVHPKRLFKDEDPDYQSNEKEDAEEKTKKTTVFDRLSTRVVWHQWVRILPITGIGHPKYRLMVFGSNGHICYYSLKQDIRDDTILKGLDALRKGMWDENATLFDLGYKKEGKLRKYHLKDVSGRSSSQERYLLDIHFKDLTVSTLTIACDSEAKWEDAKLSFKAFIDSDFGPQAPREKDTERKSESEKP